MYCQRTPAADDYSLAPSPSATLSSFRLAFSRWWLFLLEAMTEAVGLADKFHNVPFVREPPDQRVRHFLIPKNRIPIGETQIAGDDDRHPLVEVNTSLLIMRPSLPQSSN